MLLLLLLLLQRWLLLLRPLLRWLTRWGLPLLLLGWRHKLLLLLG